MTEQLTEEEKQKEFDGFLKMIQGTKDEKTESNEVIEEPTPPGEALPTPDKQPVEQPVQEDKKEPEQTSPLAFIESLPDDVKQKVLDVVKERDTFAQRDNRLRGQVSALDRIAKQERLARAELEKKLASNPAPSPPSTELPQELKELAETDPALAKALEVQAKLVEQRIRAELDQKIESSVAPIHQFREQEEQQHIVEELDRQAPGWQAIVFNQDEHGNPKFNEYSPHWQTFVQSLPVRLQQVAMEPKSLEDAMWSFKEYQNFADAYNAQYKPQENPVANTSQADAIQKKREQDLKRTPVKTPTNLPIPSGELDLTDEKVQDALFKDALSKIQGKQTKYYK